MLFETGFQAHFSDEIPVTNYIPILFLIPISSLTSNYSQFMIQISISFCCSVINSKSFSTSESQIKFKSQFLFFFSVIISSSIQLPIRIQISISFGFSVIILIPFLISISSLTSNYSQFMIQISISFCCSVINSSSFSTSSSQVNMIHNATLLTYFDFCLQTNRHPRTLDNSTGKNGGYQADRTDWPWDRIPRRQPCNCPPHQRGGRPAASRASRCRADTAAWWSSIFARAHCTET